MKRMSMLLLVALLALACTEKPVTDTSEESAVPEVPQGVALKADGLSSLTFSWSPVAGASSYHWRLLKALTEVKTGDVTATEVTVDGLEEATTYTFAVRSVAAGGTSSYSAALSATTQKTPSSGSEEEEEVPEIASADYSNFLIPAWEEDGKVRAFPGAEGGGMFTSGGRGGQVYHVTNLNDSGSGSLRYGICEYKENGQLVRPLTIVFDVAGLIELQSPLKIEKGDITVAGQTAPGDGICLKNYNFRIHANNVIVRFLRFRMGDEKKAEDDALNLYTGQNDIQDVIIDHCSLSWSTDECGTFYGMTNFTLQWCILSESLLNSVHGKGKHGYGGIWGGTNATYHHNLLAHHYSRNPRLDHDYVSTLKGPVSLVNNVIYNWGDNSTYGGESANDNGEYKKYNLIGNYYKPGPATASGKYRFIDPWTKSCDNCAKKMGTATIVPGHFYMAGNYFDGKPAWAEDNWLGTTASDAVIAAIRETAPFPYGALPTSLTLHSAQDGYSAVLDCSGASLRRDRIDERVARETREGSYTYKGSNGGTNGFIDSQADVRGNYKSPWPDYSGKALKDSDGDGIPDAYEKAWGLDSANASDASARTLDPQGRYTNLEMYLHYLVREIVAAQSAQGQYTTL